MTPKKCAGTDFDRTMVQKITGSNPAVNFLIHNRALALLFLHHVVREGSLNHPGAKMTQNQLERFLRTFEAFDTCYWGTSEQIAAMQTQLYTVHSKVKGLVGKNESGLPEDTRYTAMDPRGQQWIMATLIDSQVTVYEIFEGKLTEAQKDKLVQELDHIAGFFHPHPLKFGSWAAVSSYMHDVYRKLQRNESRSDFGITPAARDIVVPIVLDPLAGRFAPVATQWEVAIKGVLPPEARQAYALSFSWREKRQFEAMAASGRAVASARKVSERLFAPVPVLNRAVPALCKAYRLGGPLFSYLDSLAQK